uniref:Uncharacterized protein n=1 Tax=Oryza brachyantha TaxID=4533 RepID=J3MEG6_ORYBR
MMNSNFIISRHPYNASLNPIGRKMLQPSGDLISKNFRTQTTTKFQITNTKPNG